MIGLHQIVFAFFASVLSAITADALNDHAVTGDAESHVGGDLVA